MSPAGKADPWKVVGDVFLKLINRAAEHPEKMSDAERVVFRVWLLVGEVSNGGFDQYFFNSAGNGASHTVAALKTIGDDTAWKILERAMAVFPEPPSPDRDRRWKQLDGMTKKRRARFGALDPELWDCSRGVVEKLAAYIQAHRKEISPRKEPRGRRHT